MSRLAIRYRLSFGLSRCLPQPLSLWLGKVIAELVYRFRVKERQSVERNLAVVLQKNVDDSEVRVACHQVYKNFAKTCIDLIYMSALERDRFLDHMDCSNFEALRHAQSFKRGVIMLTTHIGQWEFGAMAIAANGFPITILAHPVPDTKIQEVFMKRREAFGVKVVLDSNGVRECLRVLNRNEILGIAGERLYNAKGEKVTFFGKTALLPKGPAHLSVMTGAPIVPIFAVADENASRYRIQCGEAIHPPEDKNLGAVEAYSQKVAGIMEEMIRKHPTYWFTFEDIW